MLSFVVAQPESPSDSDHSMHTLAISPSRFDAKYLMERFHLERILTRYGTTEVSGPLVAPPEKPLTRDSLGRLRSGYQVQLVDKNNIAVPIGDIGELVVRTDIPWATSAGHAKDPGATALAWRNGWLHTGDLMSCDVDGIYFFHDRNTDSMRRRGETISSSEVEEEVIAYPGFVDVACVAHPNDGGSDDEVKAWLILEPETQIDFADLLQFLVQRMPYFIVPRYFEVTDEFPRTPTLRVQKHQLRSRGNSSDTWDSEGAALAVNRFGLAVSGHLPEDESDSEPRSGHPA